MLQIVVKEKGFEFEKHYAETSDGYYLEIHRIYKGDTKGTANISHFKSNKTIQMTKISGKKAVFLQHGLMDSSATGYDVWLGNVRGNVYSTRHKVYGLNEDQFWDFT